MTYSKAKLTKKGAPNFNVKFKVLDGDNKGGEFFDSVPLSVGQSEGQKSYNKRMFAKLKAAGLEDQFFQANPSMDAIAEALKGRTILVHISWQKPNEKGQVFGEHSWAPATNAGPGQGGTLNLPGFGGI